MTGIEFVDSGLLDVKTYGPVLLAEFNRQRQPNVAEADDADARTPRVDAFEKCHKRVNSRPNHCDSTQRTRGNSMIVAFLCALCVNGEM